MKKLLLNRYFIIYIAIYLPGLFHAIIWVKTKNFWLIVSIHAFVDLLPGLNGFIETWGIN